MKHLEFYSKHKTNYSPLVNPLFSKRNWWRIGLIILGAVLFEPLIIYKHQRTVPFSLNDYLEVVQYCVIIAAPLVAFLFWINRRESIKRSRGYVWVGKFEVIGKQSTFAFCYLLLAPGEGNKLKVNRSLFEKTRVGNLILIRRDALGNIEDVRKVNNFSRRLNKNRAAFSCAF